MRYVLLVLCFTLGCPVPASIDSGRLRSQAGAQYHWSRGRFPILVMVHPDAPPQQQDAIHTAAAIWNGATGLPIFDVHVGSYFFPMFNGGPPRRGYIAVEARKDLGYRLRARVRGLAEVHLMAGELGELGVIHSAHIFLVLEAMSDDDMVAVAVHELGHCLGLTHDLRDSGSIMWPTARPQASIQPEDIAYVQSQY